MYKFNYDILTFRILHSYALKAHAGPSIYYQFLLHHLMYII
jgi:hypothetical protein